MNADTEVLFEQALKHVLDESSKLLKREDAVEMLPILDLLNELASQTHKVKSAGLHRVKSIDSLVTKAVSAEQLCDRISLSLWRPILVSVSAVYQNISNSLRPREDQRGAAAELRSHFDKIRIRLLQQTLGAKMLSNSSDRGVEIEKVWQQFLQNALGDTVRVLQGGVICDHLGNKSKHQIDLIVVPAEASVTFPSGAEDGKVHVPIDQVISAIMVTSNLTAAKLHSDWESLIDIPEYKQKEEDHPYFKEHAWPLRYIVGAQSDPIEVLKAAWSKAAEELKEPGPEFVITLDSGYLCSTVSSWPWRRRVNGSISDVREGDGVYRGLGMAWLLLQHQGRLAAMHRRALGPISRQAEALDYAGLRDAMPATWSQRFNLMLLRKEVAGVLEWGYTDIFVHNQLHLTALNKKGERPLMQPGCVHSNTWPFNTDEYRWFRYGAQYTKDDLVALEEWSEIKSLKNHSSRIVVFNSLTGEELKGKDIDDLKVLSDIEKLVVNSP